MTKEPLHLTAALYLVMVTMLGCTAVIVHLIEKDPPPIKYADCVIRTGSSHADCILSTGEQFEAVLSYRYTAPTATWGSKEYLCSGE